MFSSDCRCWKMAPPSDATAVARKCRADVTAALWNARRSIMVETSSGRHRQSRQLQSRLLSKPGRSRTNNKQTKKEKRKKRKKKKTETTNQSRKWTVTIVHARIPILNGTAPPIAVQHSNQTVGSKLHRCSTTTSNQIKSRSSTHTCVKNDVTTPQHRRSPPQHTDNNNDDDDDDRHRSKAFFLPTTTTNDQ